MRKSFCILMIIISVYLISCTTSDGIVLSSGEKATIRVTLENSTFPAEIIVDNIRTGRATPDTVSVLPGSHVLKVFLPGYKAEPESIVTVMQEKAFKEFSFSVRETNSATIYINTIPAGAILMIDGIEWGQTPLRVEGIAHGFHSITIRKSGFKTITAGLNLEENQFFSQNYQLERSNVVLLEHFSNTGCPPCPEADATIHRVMQELDSIEIAAVSYHPDFPSPSDPFYLYDPGFIGERVDYYRIFSTPSVILEGEQIYFYSYEDLEEQLKEKIVEHQHQPPGHLQMEIFVDERSPTSIAGNVKITNLSQDEFSARLMAVAVLKELLFEEPPGTNGQKDFYDLFYKAVPSLNDKEINLQPNSELLLPFTLEIENEMDRNFQLVLFVQDDARQVIETISYP
ncbi:MAG: hypothetical protein Kow00108_12680 [Calditrichia bacterium]